jgi:glycosyltransferase involved in cell wall biosynthesis
LTAHRARRRVLYFTAVDLSDANNGGTICCRTHIETIARNSRVGLHVVATGAASIESGTRRYFEHHQLEGDFVPLRARESGFVPLATRHWPMPHEEEAAHNRRASDKVVELARAFDPDTIVIDYLPSALYAPGLFSCGKPVIVITLNREADFFSDRIERRLVPNGPWRPRIALWRLARFEARTYGFAAAVVAIGHNDRPRGIPLERSHVIHPVLAEQSKPWVYNSTRSILFVGNTQHYPNADAVDWLTMRLAPELANIAPEITIKIVSRDPAIRQEWQRENVSFLGEVAADRLAQLFRTEDVFIAPISNDYGAKMKIAQALSYGTPVIATDAALSGTGDYSALPRIRLHKPDEAARIIADTLRSGTTLTAASAIIREAQRAAFAASARKWDELFGNMLSSSKRDAACS